MILSNCVKETRIKNIYKEKTQMARLESKSMTVAPSREQSTIDTYQKFGWSLVSSQEIFNKDSHLERDSRNNLNSVTETTNYVKLVFQRDTDMPNYAQIRDLNNSFDREYAYYESLSCSNPGKALIVLGIIFLIVGVICIIANAVPFGIIGAVLGVGFIVIKLAVISPKHNAKISASRTAWSGYIQQAEKLLR